MMMVITKMMTIMTMLTMLTMMTMLTMTIMMTMVMMMTMMTTMQVRKTVVACSTPFNERRLIQGQEDIIYQPQILSYHILFIII